MTINHKEGTNLLRTTSISRPECNRCCIPMKIGQAFAPVWSSSPDFIGDKPNEFQRGQTMSHSGRYVLEDCWKCSFCGHSVSLKPRLYVMKASSK